MPNPTAQPCRPEGIPCTWSPRIGNTLSRTDCADDSSRTARRSCRLESELTPRREPVPTTPGGA
eukprot:2009538-Rhodomonas_salina.1